MAENGKRVGTCLEMCPLSEMNERTRAGTLHEFEVKPETKREKFPTPIQSKVVKQFCRSSAGDILHREERLRPIHVLLKTMDYLVYEILTKKDVPWNLVYDFAFDRMRAIRQDMVIQQIGGSQKILIMERMVLFHLYAGYTLCEKPARLYDSVINETHIKECLQILLVHYSEQNSKAICRRPLFESMYLLYNLGSTDAMLRYGSLPKSLQQNSRIKRAFKMSLEYMNSNCYKVLATLKSLDIQELLAVHKNVKSAQRKLLSQIIQGFSSQTCKFPVDHFIKMMCPFEMPTRELVIWIFDIIEKSRQDVLKGNLIFNKITFDNDMKITNRRWNLIDDQLGDLDTLPTLITGKAVKESLNNIHSIRN